VFSQLTDIPSFIPHWAEKTYKRQTSCKYLLTITTKNKFYKNCGQVSKLQQEAEDSKSKQKTEVESLLEQVSAKEAEIEGLRVKLKENEADTDQVPMLIFFKFFYFLADLTKRPNHTKVCLYQAFHPSQIFGQ
jgi:hypothetical protein